MVGRDKLGVSSMWRYRTMALKVNVQSSMSGQEYALSGSSVVRYRSDTNLGDLCAMLACLIMPCHPKIDDCLLYFLASNRF